MQNTPFTKPFSEITKDDAATAGGKGASLGEMTRVGIPVPPGFVILSNAFEQFLEETDLSVEIDAILETVNHQEMHTVEHAAEKIQTLVLSAVMPKDIATEITRCFGELNTDYVAVRSSATAEDSASAAWAGQLDSYLNTTESTLLKNVQRCFASLFTPRAIFYRFENHLHDTTISVAVVVQIMVESESAGIAFSVHPVTEDRNQLIIEAGWGLGEAVVSGALTPDSYVVEKEPRRVLDKQVHHQTRGLFKAEGGGNEWCAIPDEKGMSAVLDDDAILELTELIVRIESHYGFPCDIEWARESGAFYIVQSRPITTLLRKQHGHKRIFVNYFSRETTLYYFDLWNIADRKGTKDVFQYDFKDNLFILERTGKKSAVWYGKDEIAHLNQVAIAALREKGPTSAVENICTHLKSAWTTIKPFALGQSITTIAEWEAYHHALVQFWSYINVGVWNASDNEHIPPEHRARLRAFRVDMEKYSERMSHLAVDYFKEQFPEFATLSSVVTFTEMHDIALGKYTPAQLAEYRLRLEGCFLFNGTIYTDRGALNTALHNAGIELEQPKIAGATEISGQIAMTGKTVGRVVIIEGRAELGRVRSGDILVTQMTDPNYIPQMKLASGIVTDEGGTLSHAAITSREMKKPCIIGTKIATQVLHDGDLVEVDADNGVVRILERASA